MVNWSQNYTVFVTIFSRFSRLYLILPLLNEINLDASTRSSLAIFMMIFRFIVSLHILACFWYMIIMIDKMWVPPMDFFYAGSSDIYKFYAYENEIDVHPGQTQT
jgi:hypothetical protein